MNGGSGQGFYSFLNFDNHGYEAPNYHFIESIPLIYNKPPAKDCRWDADIIVGKPLDIACDYNAAINCIVTGQFNAHTNMINFLSSKYVLNPKKIEHLAAEWNEYYKYHHCREVNYYEDITAEWEKADDSLPYSETWYNALTKLGWNVNMISLGIIPSYKKRYLQWHQLLAQHENNEIRFRFNKTNCYSWYVSATEADAKDTLKGIEKNKQHEKNLAYPQEEATHLSDAGDILLWGMLKDLSVSNNVFVDFQ